MRRRGWIAGAAAAAGLAAGVAWQRHRENAAPGDGAVAGADPAAAFWELRLPRAGGGDELALAALRGQPLLANFWATWCPPCVEEMPLLSRFAASFAAAVGGRVVGLAIDREEAVRDFLARHPVGYAIGLAGAGGTAVARDLGNASGSLPFTVVFDRRGRPVQRRLGRVDEAMLDGWTVALRNAG